MDEQATFNGAWSGPDFGLSPGEAAAIYNPAGEQFITFVGEVLQGYLVNPIPAGATRRSSIVPQSGGITSSLLYPPSNGDQFQRTLPSGGYDAYYYEDEQWLPSQPVPAFVEGFFIINAGARKNWTRTFFVVW